MSRYDPESLDWYPGYEDDVLSEGGICPQCNGSGMYDGSTCQRCGGAGES